MILIDTSAWVEYFRATGSPAAIEVRRLLSADSGAVVMCEPVAMEVLAGATDGAVHRKLEQLVNGLPSLGVDGTVDFRVAAGDLPCGPAHGQNNPQSQRLPDRGGGDPARCFRRPPRCRL